MASINWAEVEGQLAQAIADEFEEVVQEKLSTITVEEMYYLKRVLDYEPAPFTKPDVFFRVLQRKARDWLLGSRRFPHLPWEHLSRYWQDDFLMFAQGCEE